MSEKNVDCELVIKCFVHTMREIKGLNEAYGAKLTETPTILYTDGENAGYRMALCQIERLIRNREYLENTASDIKEDEDFYGIGEKENGND